MPAPPPPFDLDLLRGFIAILDHGGFTRAAERLERTQATVSLQMRRLEAAVGRRLLERRPGGGGRVVATPEGELLAPYARGLLGLAEQARQALAETEIEGRVRLGTPEDFATWHLPDILARFARVHARIRLEVTCDFSVNLLDGFGKGAYDLILFKRDPQRGDAGGPGRGVWREPLVWAAGSRLPPLEAGAPLPLVLAPAPDVYRRRALAALDRAGRPWRIAFASPSLAGLHAAVRAGLGVTVSPRGMIPPDLVALDGMSPALPALADAEIALYAAGESVSPAAERLTNHIVAALERRGGGGSGEAG